MMRTPETKILDYFIDKIYVYNDRLVITWWYCDDRTTIELDTLTEITELQDKRSNRKCSTLTQITSIEKVPFLRHFLFFVCALLRTDSLQKSILQYL